MATKTRLKLDNFTALEHYCLIITNPGISLGELSKIRNVKKSVTCEAIACLTNHKLIKIKYGFRKEASFFATNKKIKLAKERINYLLKIHDGLGRFLKMHEATQ